MTGKIEVNKDVTENIVRNFIGTLTGSRIVDFDIDGYIIETIDVKTKNDPKKFLEQLVNNENVFDNIESLIFTVSGFDTLKPVVIEIHKDGEVRWIQDDTDPVKISVPNIIDFINKINKWGE